MPTFSHRVEKVTHFVKSCFRVAKGDGEGSGGLGRAGSGEQPGVEIKLLSLQHGSDFPVVVFSLLLLLLVTHGKEGHFLSQFFFFSK